MKDTKYFLAYLIPLSAFLALSLHGLWSYSTVIFAFVMIPVLEMIMRGSTENLDEAEQERRADSRFFDWLLYLNVPIVFGLVIYYFHTIHTATLASYEITGLTLSMGTMLGACGINVAHELGHRFTRGEQLLAKILLLPELYMHFFIEHNRGHHKNIATDEDPASARFNEPLQVFWLRSTVNSYIDAWKLERQRLERAGHSFWSLQNEMLRFQLIQVAYLLAIAAIWDWRVMSFAVLIAVIGFLLLETINYIEHYGLRRQRLASGRYEAVNETHSWNSNHELGRIVLYELTRHSDHHYKSNKKYQLLNHYDASPQLPLGYPTSMLLAMVPPLWFRVMNPKVRAYRDVVTR
ncbi:MAG: alkane 1-monooxygenase [Bacteroidota bacterium]